MKDNALPYCPGCPVHEGKIGDARLQKITPVVHCAAYVDNIKSEVESSILPRSLEDEFDEGELIPDAVVAVIARYAGDCTAQMRAELDMLPELERRGSAYLLRLGSCAAKIANGSCDHMQKAKTVFPTLADHLDQ